MSESKLGAWEGQNYTVQKSESAPEADYKLEQVADTFLLLEGVKVTAIGQYKGTVYNIKVSPTASTKTLYSSSKVLNEQLLKLIEDSKVPCLINIKRVKNYYTI